MRAALLVLLLSSCVGPEAPDAALCRDVIARLCAAPACDAAVSQLSLPATGCQAALEARTGCGDDAFTFTRPTRSRVLDCRLPLVRESDAVSAHPSCDFVDEALTNCQDLVLFLKGAP